MTLANFIVWKPECPVCQLNNRIVRSGEAIMPGDWLCLRCHNYFEAKRMLKPKIPIPKEFYSDETKGEETYLT